MRGFSAIGYNSEMVTEDYPIEIVGPSFVRAMDLHLAVEMHAFLLRNENALKYLIHYLKVVPFVATHTVSKNITVC